MDILKEKDYIDRYWDYTSDLLCDELVRSMVNFRHHDTITTHYHSLYVSYCVCRHCCNLKLKNSREIVRAALLHDFYLYEWYTVKHDEYHIFYHPKEAVKNIEEHFGTLSSMQRDMILSHMFPASKQFPNSVGAWLLTMADKRCAMEDYLSVSGKFEPVYNEINRRIQNESN
jgi:uncharacterized protein